MAGPLWCTHRRRVARALGAAVLVTGTAAFAQTPPPAAPAPSTPPADTAAPAATDTPPPPAASGTAAPPPASKGNVMGYAYRSSNPAPASSPSAPHHHHLFAHHANEAVATFTGFEMLADGGSRLFVELSKQVDVGQGSAEKHDTAAAPSPKKGKKAHAAATTAVVSRLKFIIKGAEVVNPMNDLALVTVHFNTPVVRARLVPAGRDLDLVIELRADVTPQMKVVPAKDNGAMLQIDFPAGTYLPAGSDAAPDMPETSGAAPGALPPQPGGANDSMGKK